MHDRNDSEPRSAAVPRMIRLDKRFVLILACFVLSGFAGLIYQTAWLQQFALVFGTSEQALVTVLAAYMAGLALGAALAGRLADRVRRPVLLYAALELGIGLAALLVPFAIGLASRLQVALLGGAELPPEAGSPASTMFYLASSFSILLLPTALMGATLPLLARWAVRSEAEIGRRIGLLYTANTLGAAAGTLVSAFVLLPTIGLANTVLVAAAVNGLVFVLAASIARGLSPSTGIEAAGARRQRVTAGRFWILPVVALSGVVSFTWEVLWTRLLSHLLGGSVYAFATMLATFLVGLALGAVLAARLASTVERARSGFIAAQLAIGALSLAAFALVDRLPQLAARLARMGDDALISGSVLSAATLLPAAIAIGATFPFAVRYLAADANDSASASARIFAWNTGGAIVGALATGYVVLPALGFASTASLAAATSLALALAAALLGAPRRPLLAGAAIVALVTVAAIRPDTPWATLRHGPLGHNQAQGTVAYHGVGRSATVMLFERSSGWLLTANGLPESSIDKRSGRAGNMSVARWLSLLAVAARPEMQALLVVGLGAGVTVEEVPTSVEEIHVIELEPEVVLANRSVSDRRRKDPLADPRLSVHVNDARGALRLTGRHFGAIVSQPSHPWTSGASHLFTREFLQLVRQRLEPDGVFVQWMGLAFVDEALLRSLLATALAEFPYVELYEPAAGGVLVLASAAPLELASSAPLAIENDPEAWARFGIFCAEDVLATRVFDTAGARQFAADAPPITDAYNQFQTRAPQILGNALDSTRAERIWSPNLPALESVAGIDLIYTARQMLRHGKVERVRTLSNGLRDPVTRDIVRGLAARAAGDPDSSEVALRSALRLAPDSREALAALLTLYQRDIAAGEPVSLTERFAADPEAAVIEGWRARAEGDWTTLRGLDDRLAIADFRHPLFAEAIRLRSIWRVASAEPNQAREAIALLEPLLAPSTSVTDLLLRARAAAAAGNFELCLASLDEALSRLPRASDAAAEWHRILRQLPRKPMLKAWRQNLELRFRRPSMEE